MSKIERNEVNVSALKLEKIAAIFEIEVQLLLSDNIRFQSHSELCNTIIKLKRKIKELNKIIEDKNTLFERLLSRKESE